MRAATLVLLALSASLGGCGGGGDSSGPAPSGPPPVAAIVLDRAAVTLIPGASTQLSASIRDAAGATLTGRTVTWQSSVTSVASVSSDGLVTSVGNGSTSITATSEGRSASSTISVVDGAVVGTAGGTVTITGGAATLTVPAGALAAPVTITVTPLASPPSPSGMVTGTTYELGPEGTTFAQPVTLQFKYPTVAVAADSLQLLYAVHRYSGGKWTALPGSTINWATRTVTAQTSSFSMYGVRPGSYLNTVTVTPGDAAIYVGQSRQFTATALDRDGVPMSLPVRWTGPTGAPVSQTGVVTAVTPGTGLLVYASASQWIRCNPAPCNLGYYSGVSLVADSYEVTLTNTADVTVALAPVKAISISPPGTTIAPGQTLALTATLKDSIGGTLSPQFRTVDWATSNASVATVTNAGVVTAVSPGPVNISASSGGVTGTASYTVTGSGAAVATVTVGPQLGATVEVGNTLSLTVVARDSNNNQLFGRTVTWSSQAPALATVSANGTVRGVATGATIIIATIDGVQGGTQVTVTRPAPLVLGSPRAGAGYACLLRSNSTTWCWGNGSDGQTGNGSTISEQPTPSLVTNGGGFSELAAGIKHTCALNGSGQAFCWGSNTNGQLGNNSTSPSLIPAAVAGGLVFTRISVGQLHSCALTSDGAAWCWGPSSRGGSNTLTPERVANTPAFTSISAGFSNTCALTSAGAVWCWGPSTSGAAGQGGVLNTGELEAREIVGGITFVALSGGLTDHYCGLTAAGDAYCWGSNFGGKLGDGTTVSRSAPVKVATTLKFTKIAAAGNTCALAQDQTAWCWGQRGGNGDGADNTAPLSQTTPVAVLGGRQFTEISSGGNTCARTTDGTWCWGSSSNGQLGDGVPTGGLIRFVAPVKVVFPQ
jgi:alpha-tubulin suppressor-like RCC1 family protein